MSKIIIGNWKMNPLTSKEAVGIVKELKKASLRLKNTQVVVCPPAVFLKDIQSELKKTKFSLGVQNIFWENDGAYTGELSAKMAKGFGASYVIVGHSERRALGETDEQVNLKVKNALKNGLSVVLCVGEKERDKHGYYLGFVKDQVEKALNKVSGTSLKNIVIAYEPVWAIGKDAESPAKPEDLFEMIIYIRKMISDTYGKKGVESIKIIYGGSVNSKNAESFLKEGDAQGLLVGRDSLKANKFLEIVGLTDKL